MELTKQEYPAMLETLSPNEAAFAFNNRTKQIGRLPADLAEWLHERSKLEEQYAAGLRKLSNRQYFEETGDFGSFTEAWRQTLTAASNLASVHSSLAQNIGNEIEPKLRGFANEDEDVMLLSSIGGNLSGMAMDLDATRRKTIKPKDRSRAGKAFAELDNATSQWDSQAPFALEKLQGVDERRWDIVRSSLVMLQTFETDLCTGRQQSAQQCMEILLQSSVDDEIKTWPIRAIQNRHARSDSIVPAPTPPLGEPSTSMASLPTSTRGEEESSQRPPSSAVEPTTPHSGRFGALRRLGTVLSRKKGGSQQSPTRSQTNNSHRVSMFQFAKLSGHSNDKTVPPVPSMPTLMAVPSQTPSMAESPVRDTAASSLENVTRGNPIPNSNQQQQQQPIDRPFTAPGPERDDSQDLSMNPLPPLELGTGQAGSSRFDLKIRDKPIAEEVSNSERVQDARKSLFATMGSPTMNPHSVRGRRAFQSMVINQPPDFLHPQHSSDKRSLTPQPTTPISRSGTPSLRLPNIQTQSLEPAPAPPRYSPVSNSTALGLPNADATFPSVSEPSVPTPLPEPSAVAVIQQPVAVVAPAPVVVKAQPPPPPPPRAHGSRLSEIGLRLDSIQRSDTLPAIPRSASISTPKPLPVVAAASVIPPHHSKSLSSGPVAETPNSDTHSIRSGYSQSSGLDSSMIFGSEIGGGDGGDGWTTFINEKIAIHRTAGALAANIMGDVALVYNSHALPLNTVYTLRLDNRDLLDRVVTNPKALKASKKVEDGYTVDSSRVTKPSVVLKYQRARVMGAERYLPFDVKTDINIDGNVLFLAAHVTRQALFELGPSPDVEATNLAVRVYFDDSASGPITDCRLKPYTGRFTRASNMVYWILDNVRLDKNLDVGEEIASLLMRVSSAEGAVAPKPTRVEVSWAFKSAVLQEGKGEVGISIHESSGTASVAAAAATSSHLAATDPFADDADRSGSRSRAHSANGSRRSSVTGPDAVWTMPKSFRTIAGTFVVDLVPKPEVVRAVGPSVPTQTAVVGPEPTHPEAVAPLVNHAAAVASSGSDRKVGADVDDSIVTAAGAEAVVHDLETAALEHPVKGASANGPSDQPVSSIEGPIVVGVADDTPNENSFPEATSALSALPKSHLNQIAEEVAEAGEEDVVVSSKLNGVVAAPAAKEGGVVAEREEGDHPVSAEVVESIQPEKMSPEIVTGSMPGGI